jgi:hypothetical protein
MFYVFISPAISYLRMQINKFAHINWLDKKHSRVSGADHDFEINACIWGFQNSTSTEIRTPYFLEIIYRCLI